MVRQRSNKELTLRIFTDSIFRASDVNTTATVASLYVAGDILNGAVIGQIIEFCQKLTHLRIERKDNDWDAPQRRISRVHDIAKLAEALQNHSSLRDFSLQGITDCSIEPIAQALCTCPNLLSVTLKAEATFMLDHTMPLITPQTLRALLSRLTHRLSLSGVMPEIAEFQNVLTDAYVHQACKVHIFLHFNGQRKPSAFAYFLRNVMEWNQSGRHPTSKATFKIASKSLDVAFLLLRENPWLCQRVNTKARSKKWIRIGNILSQLCCVPST